MGTFTNMLETWVKEDLCEGDEEMKIRPTAESKRHH